MFDPQFRLSPDTLPTNNGTEDITSTNGPWQQMSLDRLLEHHDLTPAKPISINDASPNDLWSTSAQFNEFLNNYHRQYQQQNQPLDISSLLSSSPPQPTPIRRPSQQQQKPQLPTADNHIFEPPADAQPLFYDPYSSNHHQLSMRRDSYYPAPPAPSQSTFNSYSNRSRQVQNIQQQHQRAPPVLQIPAEDTYQQSSVVGPRHRQNQMPAYVACLNHGINYNGISGPPILLPPSF